MISRYSLPTILFATITVNSFGIEPTKRFGCHNLSSVDKIANMENKNNNLLRNLRQCIRDTRTYNTENLETAKKLNDDFVQAVEGVFYTETKFLKDLALVYKHWIIAGAFAVIFENSVRHAVSDNNIASLIAGFLNGLLCMGIEFSLYGAFDSWPSIKSKLDMRDAAENKWSTAVKIKNFVDVLQKKNK